MAHQQRGMHLPISDVAKNSRPRSECKPTTRSTSVSRSYSRFPFPHLSFHFTVLHTIILPCTLSSDHFKLQNVDHHSMIVLLAMQFTLQLEDAGFSFRNMKKMKPKSSVCVYVPELIVCVCALILHAVYLE